MEAFLGSTKLQLIDFKIAYFNGMMKVPIQNNQHQYGQAYPLGKQKPLRKHAYETNAPPFATPGACPTNRVGISIFIFSVFTDFSGKSTCRINSLYRMKLNLLHDSLTLFTFNVSGVQSGLHWCKSNRGNKITGE
jgi:hypothetical protein